MAFLLSILYELLYACGANLESGFMVVLGAAGSNLISFYLRVLEVVLTPIYWLFK